MDFVTIIDNEICDLIEVKESDTTVSSSLNYYAKKLKPKQAVQIVGKITRPFHKEGVFICSPIDFFSNPPWQKVE